MNQQPPKYNDVPKSKIESNMNPNIQYITTSERHRIPYAYPQNTTSSTNIDINPSAPPAPNTQYYPNLPTNSSIRYPPSPPPVPNIDYNTLENSRQYNSYIVPSNPSNSSQNERTTLEIRTNDNQHNSNQDHRIISNHNQNNLNIFPSFEVIEESNSIRVLKPNITNFNSTDEYIANQFNSETCSFLLKNITNILKQKFLVSNWEYDNCKNINYICIWNTNHLLLAKISVIFYNSQETNAIIPYNLIFRIETDIDVFIKTNWSKTDNENKKLIQKSFILENNNILAVLLKEMLSILKQLFPKFRFRR